MSGGVMALRSVLLAALREDEGLAALVNGVEDGVRPNAPPPVVVVGQLAASEWGARDIMGLSVRVPLTLTERSDRTDRLGDAAARVEAVMNGLPRTANGWRVGAARLDRSRTVRSADGQWSMLIDYVVRLSRLLSD